MLRNWPNPASRQGFARSCWHVPCRFGWRKHLSNGEWVTCQQGRPPSKRPLCAPKPFRPFETHGMPIKLRTPRKLAHRSASPPQAQLPWRGELVPAGQLGTLLGIALWIPAAAGMPEATPPAFDAQSAAGHSADAVGQVSHTEISQAHHEKAYAGGQPLSPSIIENWILYYTNAEREAAGLRPLTHDPAISRTARAHSQTMTEFGLYHEIHGKGPTDRALEVGYHCRAYHGDGSYSFGLSENIYKHPKITGWLKTSTEIVPTSFHNDQAMAEALVQGWMNSPGHRRNILDSSARRIGIGIAIRDHQIARFAGLHQETVFATQNFSNCQ